MDSNFVNSFNYYDLSALQPLKNGASENSEEALRAVAKQLESVFLELVLKTMHEANSSFKSDLFARDKEDFYQDMLHQQLSLSLAKSGGVGLAEVIVKQLQGTMKEKTTSDSNTLKLNLVQNTKEVPLARDKLNITPSPININQVELRQPENESKPPVAEMDAMNKFIEAVLPYAKQAAELIGVDPKLLIAQSALETGWGKHIINNENGESSHNMFGVKSNKHWVGDEVVAQTLEYKEDKPEVTKATFKAYPGYLESFMDYIKLLKTKRYGNVLENTDNPMKFLSELHQAGYATDPSYVTKVLSIYEKIVAKQGIIKDEIS
jgi:peptidoglycan hydrolase FlgJ